MARAYNRTESVQRKLQTNASIITNDAFDGLVGYCTALVQDATKTVGGGWGATGTLEKPSALFVTSFVLDPIVDVVINPLARFSGAT